MEKMEINIKIQNQEDACRESLVLIGRGKIRYCASACLCGIPCRYDGRANTLPFLKDAYDRGQVLALCPEVLGGLPTPRKAAEIRAGDSGIQVYNRDNMNLTAAFIRGAKLALEKADAWGEKIAVFKSKSPSCGLGKVYDGSFTGKLVAGNGVAARAFLDAGYSMLTEEDLVTFLKSRSKNENF